MTRIGVATVRVTRSPPRSAAAAHGMSGYRCGIARPAAEATAMSAAASPDRTKAARSAGRVVVGADSSSMITLQRWRAAGGPDKAERPCPGGRVTSVQERQRYRVGQQLVAGVVGMDVIARVEVRAEL